MLTPGPEFLDLILVPRGSDHRLPELCILPRSGLGMTTSPSTPPQGKEIVVFSRGNRPRRGKTSGFSFRQNELSRLDFVGGKFRESHRYTGSAKTSYEGPRKKTTPCSYFSRWWTPEKKTSNLCPDRDPLF